MMQQLYGLTKDDDTIILADFMKDDVPYYLDLGYKLTKSVNGEFVEIPGEIEDHMFLRESFMFIQKDDMLDFMEHLLALMETSMKPAISVLSLGASANSANSVNSKYDQFKEYTQALIEKYKEE